MILSVKLFGISGYWLLVQIQIYKEKLNKETIPISFEYQRYVSTEIIKTP